MSATKLARLAVCATIGLPITAFGQAMIEYGLGTARGSVAGASGANSARKSIGNVLDHAGKAIEKSTKDATSRPASAAAKAKPVAAAAATTEAAKDKKPTEDRPKTDTASVPKKASIRISQ